jgi:preprotein translocase subunit SecG
MFYAIVLGVHVVVCALLIVVVLLQSAKGGGLAGGSAFGGGAESTMFGARGAATMLSKATAIFGGLFMITSLTLTLLGAGRTTQVRSIVTEEASQAPIGAPTQSAPPGELPTGGGATVPPVPGDAPGTTPPAPVEGGAAPAGDTPAPAPATGDGGSADAGTAEEGQ